MSGRIPGWGWIHELRGVGYLREWVLEVEDGFQRGQHALHPTPLSLHRPPFTLHPRTHSLQPTACFLRPTPYTRYLGEGVLEVEEDGPQWGESTQEQHLRLGCGVWRLGFMVWGLECGVEDLGFEF